MAIKFKYLGWEAGYINALPPGDISVEQWEQLPAQIKQDVLEAPHCYQAVNEAPAEPAQPAAPDEHSDGPKE